MHPDERWLDGESCMVAMNCDDATGTISLMINASFLAFSGQPCC
jgi:hypothetical protein